MRSWRRLSLFEWSMIIEHSNELMAISGIGWLSIVIHTSSTSRSGRILWRLLSLKSQFSHRNPSIFFQSGTSWSLKSGTVDRRCFPFVAPQVKDCTMGMRLLDMSVGPCANLFLPSASASSCNLVSFSVAEKGALEKVSGVYSIVFLERVRCCFQILQDKDRIEGLGAVGYRDTLFPVAAPTICGLS